MKSPDIGFRSLQLLRSVAESRSFTAAAKAAGLSQSALSRQIQSVEHQLGLKVLDRTTRNVSLTEAGAILLRETESIPNILSGALRRVQEECLGFRKEVRVGISNELVLAHIPGLFHAHQRSGRDTTLVVSQEGDGNLLESVQSNLVDVAILTRPRKMPQAVEIIHEMEDQFCIIAGAGDPSSPDDLAGPDSDQWMVEQSWIFPPVGTSARRIIEEWAGSCNWRMRPCMELNDFDLMVQLVALGMGSAIVPRRACSVFPRKHLLKKLVMPHGLSRQLIAVVPRFSRRPEHVKDFVDGLLFS